MSSPELELFKRLAIEDGLILKELDNAHGDFQKTLDAYARRASHYRKFARESKDPIVVQIILNSHEDVIQQIGLITARHELQTDIAKLTSRIDDLESKLSSNQDQEKHK